MITRVKYGRALPVLLAFGVGLVSGMMLERVCLGGYACRVAPGAGTEDNPERTEGVTLTDREDEGVAHGAEKPVSLGAMDADIIRGLEARFQKPDFSADQDWPSPSDR